MAVYPLTKGERKFGAVALYSQSLSTYSADQLRTLEQVAGLISDALHNATLYAETRTGALTDALTGLPNARSLQSLFAREQARAAKEKYPLALMQLCLGDPEQTGRAHEECQIDPQTLKGIAELIRTQLRGNDMLVRYADDKFIAMFRNTPPEIITEIAVRIQTALASKDSSAPGAQRITIGVSIGQARLRDDGETLEQLLAVAEKRLEADKAARQSLSQFDPAKYIQTRYSDSPSAPPRD